VYNLQNCATTGHQNEGQLLAVAIPEMMTSVMLATFDRH
jgi:hypothetical protein